MKIFYAIIIGLLLISASPAQVKPPQEAVLDRFLRYVKIDTQSAEDQTTVPSTKKQFDLANLLADELKKLGVEKVRVSEFSIVYGLIPGNLVANPISSTLGNRNVDEGRRELVFLLKAEAWRPAFTVADDYGFGEEIKGRERMRPTDVITDVLEGISSIPSQIGDTLSTQDESDEGISSVLGDRP